MVFVFWVNTFACALNAALYSTKPNPISLFFVVACGLVAVANAIEIAIKEKK